MTKTRKRNRKAANIITARNEALLKEAAQRDPKVLAAAQRKSVEEAAALRKAAQSQVYSCAKSCRCQHPIVSYHAPQVAPTNYA